MNTNQPQINSDGYTENRVSRRMTVDWKAAVILYSEKIFKYGFYVGVAGGLAVTVGNDFPLNYQEWVKAAVITFACGLGIGGVFAAIAVFVKDAMFPYSVPTDTFRALPSMGAPGNLKPQALMGIVDGTIKFGKLKLEPKQQLAIANAIIRNGETSISQRKLAEWGVVPTKESQQAQQLKADFITTGLGEDGGNNTVVPTSAFYAWAYGIFPQLSPHPTQ